MQPVVVDYFSDVLCIWAYAARPRIEELHRNFERQVDIRLRYIPVFGAAHKRIEAANSGKDAFQSFHEHLCELAANWSHVDLAPSLWREIRPASSLNAHLYLKAAQLQNSSFEDIFRLDCRVREAFFVDGQDIARRKVLQEAARQEGFDPETIARCIDSGEAAAALCADQMEKESYFLPGSPTLVLNEGRQLLYGNVGYRLIEANVRELLHNPEAGEASWC